MDSKPWRDHTRAELVEAAEKYYQDAEFWRALAARLAARVNRRDYYCLDAAGRADVDRATAKGSDHA